MMILVVLLVFFFKQKTAYEGRISYLSSDVCSSDLLMKKDMGGAAHALALAGLVMANHLKIRLHLVIPTVENAIAGNAFRPGDVLRSRKGLTVENTNTDAEGRLILGDALTKIGRAHV